MKRVARQLLLRLHRDDRGAISVLVLLTIWCLVAGLAMVWNTAEQAVQRQNDEVLEALLAEAEAALLLVGKAKLRLVEGSYGDCVRCGEPISEGRLRALPAAEHCLACADQAH